MKAKCTKNQNQFLQNDSTDYWQKSIEDKTSLSYRLLMRHAHERWVVVLLCESTFTRDERVFGLNRNKYFPSESCSGQCIILDDKYEEKVAYVCLFHAERLRRRRRNEQRMNETHKTMSMGSCPISSRINTLQGDAIKSEKSLSLHRRQFTNAFDQRIQWVRFKIPFEMHYNYSRIDI